MSAVLVHPPTAPATPVLVAVGHAGRLLPPDLPALLRVAPDRLRQLEDPWVDRLVATVPAAGATLVVTGWARAVADVNRAPDELDPAYLTLPTDGVWRSTTKARAGLGVVPTEMAGERLYRRRLDPATIEARLDLAHRPYHGCLTAHLDHLRRRFGRALLLDVHSMPETAQASGRIDVALGDRYGHSTDPRWPRLASDVLTAAGLAVAHNRPYAGGYTVEAHGRPGDGVHALQIEFRRRLYMDEARFETHDGLARLARICHDLVKALGRALGDAAGEPVAIAGE